MSTHQMFSAPCLKCKRRFTGDEALGNCVACASSACPHCRRCEACGSRVVRLRTPSPSTKGWTVAAVKICSRCNGTGYEREAT